MSDLRALRQSIGISQLRLAHLAGVSRMRLQMAEQGLIKLSADEHASVERVLQQAGEDLVKRLRQLFAQSRLEART